MKTSRSWILLAALIWIIGPFMDVARAEAEEKAEEKTEDKLTANVSVDILSQYIFRGVALSADSAVIQPSFTVGYKGFSLNIWGNFDSREALYSRSPRWNETDTTFSYTHKLIGELSGTIGGVYYSLTNSPDDSFEVFGGLSYALPWFTVGVTGYRECYSFPGWWMQIDLSRNFKLPWHDMSVDLAASFGYLDSDTANFIGWESGQVTAALNIPVCKYFVITPRVGVAFPIHDEDARPILRNGSWDGQATHVFGGLRVSAAF